MQGDINMNGNNIILTADATTANQVPRKGQIDSALALKANTADVPTNANFTTLQTRVTAVEASSSQNATDITTVSQNLSANYYNKTAADAKYKPIAQIETKIQNAAVNSKIECTGDNSINIRANGQDLGNIFAPTGQATAN